MPSHGRFFGQHATHRHWQLRARLCRERSKLLPGRGSVIEEKLRSRRAEYVAVWTSDHWLQETRLPSCIIEAAQE
jgi:hypothetical protein